MRKNEKEMERIIKIDERELFKSVMVGFMADENPILAMLNWMIFYILFGTICK